MNVDRPCASGLIGIASSAKQIMVDRMMVAVGGGLESTSLVQNDHCNRFRGAGPVLKERIPGLYMTMLKTAEVVAYPYWNCAVGIGRERAAIPAAHGSGPSQNCFAAEIVPMTTTMHVVDKAAGEVPEREVALSADACNRLATQLSGLAALKPAFKDGQQIREGRFITAGHVSKLSDGAAACVLMEAKEAERRGLEPLGARHGIGPVVAVPKLLKQHRLSFDGIDIWELNEAFACQVIDWLGGYPRSLSAARDLG